MKNQIGVLGVLLGLLFVPLVSANAQYCNPAVVNYIVRDEYGRVVNAEELKTIHKQLPEKIGDADTGVFDVSFASDGVTHYRFGSVNWDSGKKVPTLEFANAGTCTMNLSRVEFEYRGKKMILIFNIIIERRQDARHLVIDSLPLEEGTYVLDLSGWSRSPDQLIPATYWKKVVQKDK